jgi:hypothetical protein
MPFCYCTSGDCCEGGGIDVFSDKAKSRNISSSLCQKHTFEDKLVAFKETEEQAQAAVDAQLEEITLHLSSATLADHVTSPMSNPGGRLWFRGDSDEALLSSQDMPNLLKSQTCPDRRAHTSGARSSVSQCTPSSLPTCRSQHNEVFSCLSDLESEVKKIVDDVSLHLASLVSCLPAGPSPFPLIDHLYALDSLKDCLATITFGGPSCQALKDNISTRLASAEASLHFAKRQWDNGVAATCVKQTPIYGIFYDTGMLFNRFRINNPV